MKKDASVCQLAHAAITHTVRSDSCWKSQVLKCRPDKSWQQGPHPFSIQTRRKVAYPLGASIFSPASFSLLPTLPFQASLCLSSFVRT